MKKILVLGVMAMAVALTSQERASAWVNFKFGAGVNLNLQSGGNNFLWGVFRNGQAPAPDCAPGYGYGHPPHGGGGFPGPFPQSGPQDFQYFGKQPAGPSQQTMPQGTRAPTYPGQSAVTQYNQLPNYNQSVFQKASYNPYASAPAAAYYYTAQPTYGSWNMPLYWGN